MKSHKNKKFIKDLMQAWRNEVISAANYRMLAKREKDPNRKAILTKMAEAEDRHAQRWADRLRELGNEPGEFRETIVEKMRRVALLNSPSDVAAKMLEAGEVQADSLYDEMLETVESEKDRRALLEAQQEEQEHTRMLEQMDHPAPSDHPQYRLERILGKEKWHVRGGGWIGQAIYGVNDGLGAAFGVVSGVAGATNVNGQFVLLSGLATAIASALSMGSGAYLATKSEREVYQAEMERERKEIEMNPAEEQEELELFYQLKGFSAPASKTMASQLAKEPDQMLTTLAHEELGLSEKTFPNPWKSAVSASISTAVGAAVPVIPFFFASGMNALIASFIISTIAHFVVGASKVVITGRSWLRSGTEMTVVGVGEAAVTYLIGRLVSPMIG